VPRDEVRALVDGEPSFTRTLLYVVADRLHATIEGIPSPEVG
jgi:CRP-like cAMP-binding protein